MTVIPPIGQPVHELAVQRSLALALGRPIGKNTCAIDFHKISTTGKLEVSER